MILEKALEFCEGKNWSWVEVTKRSRIVPVVEMRRQVAEYLHSRGFSFSAIGRLFGLHHSTIMSLLTKRGSSQHARKNADYAKRWG